MPSIWPPPGPQQALEPGSILYVDSNTTVPSGGYAFRGSNTNSNTIGTYRAPGGVITNMDEVSMKDLQSEAFNTPIATLIDLWLTRYGNEWVDMDKIEGDEFYVLAYKRLKSLGQLETHYLTDRARFVCRKPT
jgi:hypothetical protein